MEGIHTVYSLYFIPASYALHVTCIKCFTYDIDLSDWVDS